MEFLRVFRQQLLTKGRLYPLRSGELQGSTMPRAQRLKPRQTAPFHHNSHSHSHSHGTINVFWRTRWSKARNIRWQSSKPSPNPTEHLGSPEPASLSARMKKLSREYGWSALGVYLGLSALDFPFCYLGVRLLGTERIGHWEHVVVETFWSGVHNVYPDARAKLWPKSDENSAEKAEAREGSGWGVEEADAKNKSDSASECGQDCCQKSIRC